MNLHRLGFALAVFYLVSFCIFCCCSLLSPIVFSTQILGLSAVLRHFLVCFATQGIVAASIYCVRILGFSAASRHSLVRINWISVRFATQGIVAASFWSFEETQGFSPMRSDSTLGFTDAPPINSSVHNPSLRPNQADASVPNTTSPSVSIPLSMLVRRQIRSHSAFFSPSWVLLIFCCCRDVGGRSFCFGAGLVSIGAGFP